MKTIFNIGFYNLQFDVKKATPTNQAKRGGRGGFGGWGGDRGGRGRGGMNICFVFLIGK